MCLHFCVNKDIYIKHTNHKCLLKHAKDAKFLTSWLETTRTCPRTRWVRKKNSQRSLRQGRAACPTGHRAQTWAVGRPNSPSPVTYPSPVICPSPLPSLPSPPHPLPSSAFSSQRVSVFFSRLRFVARKPSWTMIWLEWMSEVGGKTSSHWCWCSYLSSPCRWKVAAAEWSTVGQIQSMDLFFVPLNLTLYPADMWLLRCLIIYWVAWTVDIWLVWEGVVASISEINAPEIIWSDVEHWADLFVKRRQAVLLRVVRWVELALHGHTPITQQYLQASGKCTTPGDIINSLILRRAEQKRIKIVQHESRN